MKKVVTFVVAAFGIFCVCGQVVSAQGPLEPFKRFEYKYSFKPPYLAQKDGSVPFWEHSGSKEHSICILLF